MRTGDQNIISYCSNQTHSFLAPAATTMASSPRRAPLLPRLTPPMNPVRLILFLIAAVCAQPVARAHLPGESSLVITADAESVEILVSLSLPAAASLLPADAGPLSSTTLDKHRATLLAAAPSVCMLLDPAGKAMEAQRVLVSVFQDHEVRFHFLFPPAARPARLRMPLLANQRGEAFCAVSDLRQSPPARVILTPESLEHTFAPAAP